MYKRIKELRKTLKLNQTEFSKKLGLSQSSLAMIEVGKRKYSDKHIRLICSVFHVNENWLRTGQGEIFLLSCFDEEFIEIFEHLLPETQGFLLHTAKQLLAVQNRLLERKPTVRYDED